MDGVTRTEPTFVESCALSVEMRNADRGAIAYGNVELLTPPIRTLSGLVPFPDDWPKNWTVPCELLPKIWTSD